MNSKIKCRCRQWTQQAGVKLRPCTQAASSFCHSNSGRLRNILIVQDFPLLFASLTCQQEQYITVLSASWFLRSTSERHTVVYPIGKNLLVFKTSFSHRWSQCRSILDPGQVPEIKGVTKSAVFSNLVISCWTYGCRFPAQEYISGAPKIPTVIYYDQSGKVKAAGAEAMKESIYLIAEDENWVKAEW